MAAILLALIAALAQPGPYQASGSEPFWSLEIAGGRITYRRDGEDISVRAPRRRPTADGGYRYATRRLVVEIRPEPCEDEAARVHDDSVRVTANGVTVEGCGGAEQPPDSLVDTSWTIVAISGEDVLGDRYWLGFSAGRLTGQAGCNRFSGPYSQSGRRLIAGPIVATRMACPAPRMARERAVLHVLGQPMSIVFHGGDTMVLVAGGAMIRLRRS